MALFHRVTRDFPGLNVLWNNAGVMRYAKLAGAADWAGTPGELETNLAAPVHLSMLFAAHLAGKEGAAILNTTSGLSHVPLAAAPIYSATKAALNSFTQSLRLQLAGQRIEVIEVSPPHVNTDLGIPGTNGEGMDLDQFADAVMEGLRRGRQEITVGFSERTSQAGSQEREAIFAALNVPGHAGSGKS